VKEHEKVWKNAKKVFEIMWKYMEECESMISSEKVFNIMQKYTKEFKSMQKYE